uniref:Uncharacterized protein n=1 Tax=Oryza meridionalis TaxID=40149 RepID=A0A0E0CD58_9ORYZ
MATPGHRQHALTARLAAAPRPACAVELLSPRRARSFRRVREAEPARLVRAVAASPAWPLVNLVGGEHVAAMMTAVGARPVPAAGGVPGGAGQGGEARRRLQPGRPVPGVAARAGSASGPRERSTASWTPSNNAMVQDHLKAMEERREEVADGVVVDGDGDGAGERDEDLLGILLRFQRDGGLGITLTNGNHQRDSGILAGGSDTTTTTVMWAMSELLRCPRAMQGRNKVDEAYILEGPFNITCNWSSKKRMSDAGKMRRIFDLRGLNMTIPIIMFLPGGFGRRMFPDFIFAQFNIEIALANLLYHFDWEMPCSENSENRMELDMHWWRNHLSSVGRIL